jgi:tetratricopeptide (TPR) repeat protein
LKVGQKKLQAATLVQQSLILYQEGRLNEVQAILEQALILEPNHFDALQLLGTLFLQIENYSKATEFLSKAIKINPSHPKCHLNKGVALHALKRFDEALANFDQAIRLKPDYAEVYSNRGDTLKELQRFDEALASFDKAICLKPDYAHGYNNRGEVLLKLQRFAVQIFELRLILSSAQPTLAGFVVDRQPSMLRRAILSFHLGYRQGRGIKRRRFKYRSWFRRSF